MCVLLNHKVTKLVCNLSPCCLKLEAHLVRGKPQCHFHLFLFDLAENDEPVLVETNIKIHSTNILEL